MAMRIDLVSPGASLRMVEDAAVTHVDLGRLHLSLREVLVPGGELPHHEGAAQEVEVAPHRRLADAQRACGLGRAPDASVIVSDHRPEALQRESGHADSHLGEIALEEGLDELLAPARAVGLRAGEERAREGSAPPVELEPGGSHLGEAEAGQGNGLDSMKIKTKPFLFRVCCNAQSPKGAAVYSLNRPLIP